jgi:hypothetical protein
MTYFKPYSSIILSLDFIRTLPLWEKSLKNVWSLSTHFFDVILVLFQITVYRVSYIKLLSISTSKNRKGRAKIPLWNLKNLTIFCSLVTFQYIIDSWLLSERRPFRIFWGYFQVSTMNLKLTLNFDRSFWLSRWSVCS